MKSNVSRATRVAFTVFGALSSAGAAHAQVAGRSTTVDVNVNESTQLAMGWSVKNTLLGKTVYNDAEQKIGKVEDLIISPNRSLSYVIVGAGGFVGIGRHDVAIEVSRIQDKGGKLVLPGATRDTIKSLPEFVYATDTSRRDAFLAAADKDVARGKAAVATLERKSAAAGAGMKAGLDGDIVALKADVKTAEGKLTQMKQAGAARWREFEVEVDAATARLRKSTDKATG